MQEGWNVFNVGQAGVSIERIDCPADFGLGYAEPLWESDDAVIAWLKERAGDSWVHRHALTVAGLPWH